MPLITHNSYPKKVKIKDPNESISSTNGAFRCLPVPSVPPALPALGSPTTAASKSFAASSKSPVAKLNSPSSVKPGKNPLKRKNHGSTRHNLGPGTAVTTLQRCTEYFEGFLLFLLMWVLHDIATFERELLEEAWPVCAPSKPLCSFFKVFNNTHAPPALGGTGRQAETNDSWISYDFIISYASAMHCRCSSQVQKSRVLQPVHVAHIESRFGLLRSSQLPQSSVASELSFCSLLP